MTIAAKEEDRLRKPTLLAWRLIADPLLELLFDTGLTVQDITSLIRERSIHTAARIVMKECGRVNNSRIAIMTGLPRSEIARVLKVKNDPAATPPRSHPVSEVLAAWTGSSTFRGKKGKPAVLPIFGKQGSFEQLVRINGRGIPVRAMLDQLLQINAIEILRDQRVRPRAQTELFASLSGADIEDLGKKTADLIYTLKSNLKRPNNSYFEQTVLLGNVELDTLQLIRNEIAVRGAKFIDNVSAFFLNSSSKHAQAEVENKQTSRVGVTLFYFENGSSEATEILRQNGKPRRKNLKRTIKT